MKILMVEDERMTRIALTGTLRKEGHEVTPCPDGDTALAALDNQKFDVVLTDLNMPGPDGIEVLRRAVENDPETKVIIMTAYASTETAVEALRIGAYDYLSKPFQPDELLARIGHIEQLLSVQKENKKLKRRIAKISDHNIVGNSPLMTRLVETIDTIAQGEYNVLVQGPSGTGKELVARAIHQRSERQDNPMVAINCTAIPESLLESELFGYRKGAFTGADRDHDGYFRRANGGSLFIDDIDDLPLSVQVKLLRVIQEKEIEPVGGRETIPVDFRLISATKVNLQDLVAEGKFREDLYYRLNVIPLVLPTLSERKEDIPALVRHFSQQRQNGKQLELKEDQFQVLMNHHWPGNVRELQNVVERMMALPHIPVQDLFDGPLEGNSQAADSSHRLSPSNFSSYRQYMQKCEDRIIQWALREADGNISTAARILDLPRSTLRSKLEKR
ncbi:MAG: sigma-54-dependent Fis family transcriptional regulator [bacterium]|nr:sigma-54-dependent Fis family transcriptional regulator [bacterium]